MPHAELNGQTIHYDVHGDSSAEPLLCIHGLSADRVAWALQIGPWSQQHRVVVFDNRDVGESSYATAEYTTKDMAADALALADHLGLDRFHLLGISLGGMAAQELAGLIPGAKLTIMEDVGHGAMWERAEDFNRIVLDFLAATPSEAVR